MENFVSYIVSLLLGYIVSIITSRKSNLSREKRGFFHHLIVFIPILLLAIGLYCGGLYISSIIRGENKLGGIWIEKYEENGQPRFAIADFEYQILTGVMKFEGEAYDKNGEWIGGWHTIESNLRGKEFFYLFKGHSQNADNQKRGDRNGAGRIFFEDDYIKGTGHFSSLRMDKEVREFTIFRLIKKEAVEELKKDRRSFIQKLYDESYFKQITSIQ